MNIQHEKNEIDNIKPNHPVELIQNERLSNENLSRKQMLGKVYGMHMPMKLQMEENILAQFRRVPTLKSNFVGLETMSGLDETVEFEDYLGSGDLVFQNIDIHSEMEARTKPTNKRI